MLNASDFSLQANGNKAIAMKSVLTEKLSMSLH